MGGASLMSGNSLRWKKTMLITPFAQTLPSMPLYNKAFRTMLIFTDPLGFRTNWGPTHLVVSDDRKTFGKILPPEEDVIEPSVARNSLFETTELIVKPLSSTLLSYPGLQLESLHKLPPGISLKRRKLKKCNATATVLVHKLPGELSWTLVEKA